MSDDRYREPIRAGLAPFVDDVPAGPDWEDLIADDDIITAAYPPRKTSPWITTLGVSAAIVLLVGLAMLLSPSTPLVTSGSAGTPPLATSASDDGRPEPLISNLPIDRRIPLRIVAVRTASPSIAVADLEARSLTEYPPGSHGLPADSTDGAVITPKGDVIIWTQGVARLFEDDLDSVTRVLRPTSLRNLEGIAPSLRVVPLQGGQRVWLVQPGLTTDSGVEGAQVDLFDVSTGRLLLSKELEADAYPVASTGTGLILNAEGVLPSDGAPATAGGSPRVLHLLEDGTVSEVSRGRALASSMETIAVLVCPIGAANCEPFDTNDLVLTDMQSGRRVDVTKPAEGGVWMGVGGPNVPSQTMPLRTTSPDGTTLLVGLGLSLDVNATPAESFLVVVDLADGTTRTLARFNGPIPLATWSADGQWVALMSPIEVDGIDIELINFKDPNQTITLEDVMPPEHLPLAAG